MRLRGLAMIIVIDGLNRHDFGAILDDMHKLRAREFGDRLGWDVAVRDRREADSFDALDPAYLVSLDEAGAVTGCLRLLQTTGAHMLAGASQPQPDRTPPLRSARLWEATRLCIDTGSKPRHALAHVAAELMIGALEYARAAGVLDLVAVIDPEMNNMMRQSAILPYDKLGTPGPVGKTAAMAVLMECSQARIAAIRDRSGIAHDVFLSEVEARALRAPISAQPRSEINPPPGSEPSGHAAAPSALHKSLQAYARAQLRGATTREEVKAAQALIDLLAEQFGTSGAADPDRVQEFLPRHSRQQALVPAK